MTGIPEDVMKAAHEAVDAMPKRPPFKMDMAIAIAAAIIAERKRCAAAAKKVYDDWNFGPSMPGPDGIDSPPTAEDASYVIMAGAVLAERKQHDQVHEALRTSNQCLRDVAMKVGPLHAFWDVIAANDAIFAGYK